MWLFITDQVFGEDHRHREEPKVFSIWLPIFLLNLYLYWFLILYINHFQLLFHFLFIWYHLWTFICYIAVLSCHHSDYIAYSGYFKLSIYTWIFFSRIYVIDSRRVSVSTYFGKRSVTGFFCIRAGFDVWFLTQTEFDSYR